MMKNIVTLILCLMVCLCAGAQEPAASSLSPAYQCLSQGLDCLEEEDFDQARRFFVEGCGKAASEAELKKCKYYVGVAYYIEASNLIKLSYYKQAYRYLGKALDLFKEAGRQDKMVKVYASMAQVNEAGFSNYRRALDHRMAAYKTALALNDTLAQVQTLMDVANCHTSLEQWEQRSLCYAKIDTLVMASQNPDLGFHVDILLGQEAMRSGRYDEAETFFERSFGKVRREGQTIYLSYAGLRDVAMMRKDYKLAFERSKDCVREFGKIFKNQPVQRYFSYVMHGEICARMKDREGCFRCADSLFRCLDYGIDKSGVADLYMYRGMWHVAFEEYDEAIRDYEVSQGILETIEDKNVVDAKRNLLGLKAGVLTHTERYDEAAECAKTYVKLTKDIFGAHSGEYAQSLENLANVQGFQGKYEEGAQNYQQAVKIKISRARSDLKVMPSSVREQHWLAISRSMWKMASYGMACHFEQNEFTGKAYDAQLFSKGLLLASEKSLESDIAALNDSVLTGDYYHLLYLRKKMTDAEAKNDTVGAAKYFEELNQLDRHMTLKMVQRSERPFLEEISFKDIAKALKKGEVVVDFTDFDHRGTRQYMAYVLAHGWKYPKLVKVTEGEKIDSLLQQLNGCIDRFYEREASEALLDMLWKPLVKAMPDAKTVFYVPSGILHQIALGSIQVDEKKLLGDKYKFVRLSSAKEVLTYKEHRKLTNLKSAVLYGGLEYDMGTKEMVTSSEQYDLSSWLATRGETKMKGGKAFEKLFFSEDEVIAIEKILSLKNIKVRSYTGKSGTEESFLSMTGQAPDLLQVSTHGFFYMPEEKEKTAVLSGYKDIMYLTGLVMAGGNSEWLGRELPEGIRGGLLTSDDISQLDLSNAQLVVLSACETGRGKVTNEGLYGLQRAFKKAGVQTMVMSLWQVSDMATKDFMIAFYTHLSKNGWDKRDAFRKAKREMKKKYEEPAYWAGFVIVD